LAVVGPQFAVAEGSWVRAQRVFGLAFQDRAPVELGGVEVDVDDGECAVVEVLDETPVPRVVDLPVTAGLSIADRSARLSRSV
jgi:hypothetical protein